MAASSITVTGASFTAQPPAGTPAGVGDAALTSFPTDGSGFGVLSSGNATNVDQPGTFTSVNNNGGAITSRGDTAADILVLKVDFSVPVTRNCLSVDFQFLSEEYDNFVGSNFNDAFIAELDSSSWSTAGSAISAPNNFAFDPSGNVISINSAGVASMSYTNGAGTAFDTGNPSNSSDQLHGGATTLLRASTPVAAGAHSVYFSIFDQGDQSYDSAVFLDNLSLGTTSEDQCLPGAQLPEPTIEKEADSATSAPGEQNGYRITVSNPNEADFDIDSITDDLPEGFTYEGPTTGDVTGDPEESEGSLTWEGSDGPLVTVPANDFIEFHFNVIVSDDPGTYENVATAQVGDDSITTGSVAPIEVVEPDEPEAPIIEKEADEPTSEMGTQNGYKITITNPNDEESGEEVFALEPMTFDSITDTLPIGFSYVNNSTSGITSNNPTISGSPSTGQVLTWDVSFEVPSQEQRSLLFNVLVSGTPGQYLNQVSVHDGDTELATGATAPIDVTAAPLPPQGPLPTLPVSLPCDPITAEGGPGGDRMVGSVGADRIRSLAGRDIVDTGAGNDEICGGEGGDFLYGRAGSDIIRGEGGNDRLFGGLHADTLYGDAGHDALIGGKGPDSFFTQDGVKDCIMTGKGKDTVTGDVGLDLVDPRGGCPPGF